MWKSISWLISIFLSLYGRKTEKDMKGWSHGLNLRAVRRKPCEALDWPRWHLESGQTSPTLGIHIPPSTREWRGRKLTLRTKYSDTILQPLFPYPQSHLSSCQCWLSINSVSLLLVPFYTEEKVWTSGRHSALWQRGVKLSRFQIVLLLNCSLLRSRKNLKAISLPVLLCIR